MMLQEIAPHVLRNEFSFRPPEPEDLAFLWQDGKVLLRWEGNTISLPRVGELPGRDWRYLFSLDGVGVYLLLGEAPELSGLVPLLPRAAEPLEPKELAFAVCVGGSLARWYGANRFCGGCGAPMEPSGTERAMVCPVCGGTVYPKICPAVIVGVSDGEKLLLTRYAGRSFKRWALVAGFAEIGETIEQTVCREVREETGLEVEGLQYYRSQPWGFTDTLLLGFFCRVRGGRAITLQLDELSEAQWFSPAELPTDHTGGSLTGEMIELWREKGPGVFQA